jgi:hypothetical protein
VGLADVAREVGAHQRQRKDRDVEDGVPERDLREVACRDLGTSSSEPAEKVRAVSTSSDGRRARGWPTVRAESVSGYEFQGRNLPVLLDCVTPEGAGLACVVKLAARLEQPDDALWSEWVAGRIADAVGIFVPRRYVVEISPTLSGLLAKHLKPKPGQTITPDEYAGPSLGVEYLRNVQPVPKEENALEEQLRVSAAEIAVFDAFIENLDRRPTNPNCLVHGTAPPRLVAIDHDLAFAGLWLPVIGGSTWPTDLLARHLFTRRFGKNRPSVSRIKTAIGGLSDEFLDGLPEDVPSGWLSAHASGKLTSVIRTLKIRRDTVDDWFSHVENWLNS